jgi:DNA polymerase II small subunit/DNA polymerase delta subunit B
MNITIQQIQAYIQQEVKKQVAQEMQRLKTAQQCKDHYYATDAVNKKHDREVSDIKKEFKKKYEKLARTVNDNIDSNKGSQS